MSARRLSRAAGDGRAAAPVRLVHLGLGNFFRSHQAAYTDRSPDAADWGYAAFTGHQAELASALAAQDGLYTLAERAPEGDCLTVISSLSSAHPAADHDAWLAHLGSATTAVVTLTVTEAAYLRGSDGHLAVEHPDVAHDLLALQRAPCTAASLRSVPGRLMAGLAERRRRDGGPLALVPCDNLPGNGAALWRVLADFAQRVDPGLAGWITENVSFVSTVVDRITPRTTAEDRRRVDEETGLDDRCPVVAEPFSEWVLSGAFPAGRPAWEGPGATFVEDVTAFERRKLWLLNGAHSLLAYAGPLRGHTTVDEAIADDVCRGWVEQWWDEASGHIQLSDDVLAAYRAALVRRFSNTRIRHLLAQIAADGSQKLPARILPVLRAERAAGELPHGAVRVLAAWVCHLRAATAPVIDPRVEELRRLAAAPLLDATIRVLCALASELADDSDVVASVAAEAGELLAGQAFPTSGAPIT